MLLKVFYASIRPFIVDWVTGRALRMPSKKLGEISKRHGVSESTVRSLEDEISRAFLAELDKKVYGKEMSF